jgi:hypothetical protein
MSAILYKKTDEGVQSCRIETGAIVSYIKQGWSTSPCGTNLGMKIQKLRGEINLANRLKQVDRVDELTEKLNKLTVADDDGDQDDGDQDDGDPDDPDDEAAIRARAKELKIPSWHNRKLDKLKELIAEAEKEQNDWTS